LLSDEEKQQVLGAWNATKHAREWRSLSDSIAEQVARAGDRIAAACGDDELSYAALWRRCECLARKLRSEGIGPETIVPLLVRRGIPYLEAMLAIIRARGAYLPLEPRHPIKRNIQVIKQSGATHLIAEKKYAVEIEEDEERQTLASIRTITTETLATEVADHCLASEEQIKPERNLAYVIYTSGATGVPKGAMVEEKGMVNHLWAKVKDLDLTEEDVLAQTASQAFDISVWQNLAALIVGGRVQIVKDEEAHD